MTTDVLATYDLLASLIDRWQRLPRGTASLGGEAASRVVEEARLLDDRRFDEWLAGWSPDGALWVPLAAAQHPATDQAYYLDDVRRLAERVAWTGSGAAWSQQRRLQTVRQIGNVESFTDDDGLHARSVVTLHEQRGPDRSTWPMCQLHLFGAGGRCRAKVLLLPAFGGAVPHPGALL